MMDGPHMFGFSPAALCISLTSALASARLVASARASINAATLNLVGLVLFSAIPSALRLFARLTWVERRRTRCGVDWRSGFGGRLAGEAESNVQDTFAVIFLVELMGASFQEIGEGDEAEKAAARAGGWSRGL